jgi:hypothetical protein
MRFPVSVAHLALGLALAACHRDGLSPALPTPQRDFWFAPDLTCSDASPRSLPPTRVSDTVTTPEPARSDQQWAVWARIVPGGWGGGPYYLPSVPGPPTILLRDTTRKEAALAALDTLLPPAARRSAMPPQPILVRQVRWDLAELYDWKEFIESNFGSAQGTTINSWGISNQRNAIMIGIEKREALLDTMRWLQGLGIPCRLVVVEVLGRISLT